MLRAITLVVVATLTALLLACATTSEAPIQSTITTASPAYQISGPFTHDNLTLFLIHAPDRLPGKTYLTLQEALDQKKVVVHETGNVNELTIENTSADDVYIQSGEIVKGGQQDRTLQNDLVLAPNSGKIPVAAFCVEHGRWQQRGSEESSLFNSSANSLSSKSLKLSAKAAGDQSAVWKSVGETQKQLAANADHSVYAAQSASSLQLSLENTKVQEAVNRYRNALQPSASKPDIVGYAFAVNGKLNSVDIYGSHALFSKMWDKNLQAAATEAFAEYRKDAKWTPVTAADLKTCIDDATTAKQADKQTVHNVTLLTRESAANRCYETYTPNAPAPAHLNIITRDPETDKILQNRQSPSQNFNQSDITPNLPTQNQQDQQSQQRP